MKTKAFIITIALLLGSITASSQESPFKGFSDVPFIGTTFITKSMLEMAPNVRVGGAYIQDLVDVIDQVEIYNSRIIADGPPISTIKMAAMSVAKEEEYSLIMMLSDEAKDIAFYAKTSDEDKNIIKDLIMISYDTAYYNATKKANEEKCTVIRLVGNFTIEDIQGITGKNKLKIPAE